MEQRTWARAEQPAQGELHLQGNWWRTAWPLHLLWMWTDSYPRPPALSQMKIFSKNKFFFQIIPSFMTLEVLTTSGTHLCLPPNPSSYSLYPLSDCWHITLGLALLNTKHGVQQSVYEYGVRFIFELPWNVALPSHYRGSAACNLLELIL